jgi:nucleobase:cation symporter-1, NCS1 family
MMDTTMPTQSQYAELDVAGRVEVRGIDYVPDEERHGKPRELFWIWLGANVTYLYFTLGGFVLLAGLSLWQAIAVVVIGNLYWFGVGALAVSGPSSGTPSVVVTRAMFGIRGNRPLSAGIGWLVAIVYEFINLALGALAGFALADQLGLGDSWPVRAVILVIVAVLTFAISIYGHATIAKLSPYFSAILAIIMLALGVFVVAHTQFDYQPPEPLDAAGSWVAVALSIALIAGVPLSWATGADYARYLPRTTSQRKVLVYTALGGFVPAVLLAILGVLAGTAIDMNDAQTNLASIVPGWFYPIFLLVIVLSSITNNVLTAYSSGLCLQALGVKMSRARTVFIDGVLSTGLAAYALFVSDFLDSLSKTIELSVAVLGPSMALYITDIVLRRNHYDGVALNDEQPKSRYWYRGGWNVAGSVALVAGVLACLLLMNTSVYTGPLSNALGGADLSFLIGPLVTAVVYWALFNRQRNASELPA